MTKKYFIKIYKNFFFVSFKTDRNKKINLIKSIRKKNFINIYKTYNGGETCR